VKIPCYPADLHTSGPPPDRGQDEREANARNPGSNLFVTGIHPRLSESEVSRLFEKYGNVEGCSIMKDPHTQESRGFGFVKMVTAEEADAAKDGLQGENIEGRTLSIEKARRARPRTPTPGKYFGPPKRGRLQDNTLFLLGADFNPQKRTSVVHLVVADLIVLMIVVEVVAIVDMVVDDTMTATAALHAMTTVSVVHMDVVTTMGLVASTVMPQAAGTIATAAVAMITAVAAIHIVEMVDALEATGMLHGTHASLTVEVETKTTALTIGTPVVKSGPLIYSGAERSTK